MASPVHFVSSKAFEHHRTRSFSSQQLSVRLQQPRLRKAPWQPLTSPANTSAVHTATDAMEPNQSPTVRFAGWPRSVNGDLVWSGTGASPADPHVIQLQSSDIAEIESAVESFKERELHGDQVSCESFPLSTDLKTRLLDAAQAVHYKHGYCLLRGLDPAKYSAEDNAMIFLGVASYMGNVRGVQDSNGNMLSHITVVKQWEAIPDKLRHGVHTTQGLPFHNDMGTDILALHYRQCATEGGFTHLASAWTLYNELSAKYPDVLRTLATPNWPIQITKRKSRHYLAPLIEYHDGRIMVSLDPGRLGRQTANREHAAAKNIFTTARPDDSAASRVPTLTQAQHEALDTLNRLAQEHKISVAARPGDMLFINNWALLHARDPYADYDGSSARRHLVRLWLHNEDLAWSVPASMKTPWAAAFGYRFGDAVDPTSPHPRTMVNRKYPIVPATDYRVPKYTAGSAAFVIDSSDEECDSDRDNGC